MRERERERMTLINSSYIQITSPIRRLCDILNLIIFQQKLSLIEFSQPALDFYTKWTLEISRINTDSKSIRKVQRDASMLELYSNNPKLFDTNYEGYFIEKTIVNDSYKYTVYIPELKYISEFKSILYFELFEKNKFQIYLFENESTFKKKIRIGIL